MLKQNALSLEGKVVAITGSTGGIGVHLCSYIASLGARLVLCDRNKEKVSAIISSLKEKYGDIATHVPCDLSDIDSVKLATEKLKSMPIDYFISNAGAYSIPRNIANTGYDNVYTINFLSPYYMIRQLEDGIKERGGRIVIVGSIAHKYSKADFDNVDFRSVKAASKVYGNAKRYLMFSLMEHFKICPNAFAVTHPGITFTNITAHYPKLIFAIIKYPMKIIFPHPKRAALCILAGLFEPTAYHKWIGPALFNIWGKPKKQALHTCKVAESKKIYSVAEKIYSKM